MSPFSDNFAIFLIKETQNRPLSPIVREWGDTEGARAKISGYEDLGIGIISMKDDFAVIYGDGVQKDVDAAK